MKRLAIVLAGVMLAANAWAGFSLTAVGGFDQVPTNGTRSVTLQLTGTWSATVVVLGTLDSSNFVTLTANTGSAAFTANGLYSFSTAGMKELRVRCSAYTSGTITGELRGGNGDALGSGDGIAAALASMTSTAQGYQNVSRTSVALDAITAYSMALSTTAGINGPVRLRIWQPISGLGANIIRAAITNSQTAPADLSTTGMPVFSGDYIQLFDTYSASGNYLHMIVPAASTPTTATAQIGVDKYVR